MASRFLPRPPQRPAPMQGEHTVELARELLGLDDASIARLVDEGALERPADLIAAV